MSHSNLRYSHALYTAVLLPSLPEDGVGTGLRKVSMMCETLMAASTHTMGVSVSIKRTITPAK